MKLHLLGPIASAIHAALAVDVIIPEIPTDTTTWPLLDRRLASLSMEFSFLPAFGGNETHPNELTRELMSRLVERTGVGPDIRPGGITIDSSIYSPTAPALVLDQSPSGGIYRTTFGPKYFESLNVFPKSSRITMAVNLGNNTISIARDMIAVTIKYVGWDRIYALELGNEADHYAGGSRPRGWGSANYTAQFLDWTAMLNLNLNLPSNIWQAGGFAEDPTSAAPMTTVSIIKDGIDSKAVKLYAHHTYQYSTCDPRRNAIATLPNLINHKNITTYLDLWKPQIAASTSVGKEFVVGEYSSVSCSGKQNVTDTFGQALWMADTILYAASINIKRMYAHQGATLVLQSSQQANSPGFSWYDLWYPVNTERYGAARASPSFVAYLLVNELVGSSGISRIKYINLPSQPQLAVYVASDGPRRRIAIINMNVRSVGASQKERDAVAVVVRFGGKGAKVKRMTALGLSSKDVDNVTWAGQAYTNGTAAGKEVIETVDGNVRVEGSEGVLVFL